MPIMQAAGGGSSLAPMTEDGNGRHGIKILHDSLFSSPLQLCPDDRRLSDVGVNNFGPKATAWVADPRYAPGRGAFILVCGRRRATKARTVRTSDMNPKNNGSYMEGEEGGRRKGKECSPSGKGQKGEGAGYQKKKRFNEKLMCFWRFGR